MVKIALSFSTEVEKNKILSALKSVYDVTKVSKEYESKGEKKHKLVYITGTLKVH